MRQRLVICLLCLSLVGIAAQAQEPRVLRSRFTSATPDVIRETTLIGQEMPLRLFDGLTYTAVLDKIEDDPLNGFVWRGHLKEAPGWVTLVLHKGAIAGVISTPEATYWIRYIGGRDHVIDEMDILEPMETVDDAVIPDGLEIEPVPDFEELDAPAESDAKVTLDILVLYNKKAPAALVKGVNTGISNKTKAMNSQIKLTIAIINQVLENSGIKARVRLVKVKKLNLKASGDGSKDLKKIQVPNDGKVDQVHAWRTRYGADFVMTIVDKLDPGVAGRGYQLPASRADSSQWAFSIILARSLWAFTTAHELGHNMGLAHDKANDTTPAKWRSHKYALGYRNPSAGWRTVMSYQTGCASCKWRIPHYSSAKAKWKGASTASTFYTVSCGDGQSTGPKCGGKLGNRKADATKSIKKSLKFFEAYEACKVKCNAAN